MTLTLQISVPSACRTRPPGCKDTGASIQIDHLVDLEQNKLGYSHIKIVFKSVTFKSKIYVNHDGTFRDCHLVTNCYTFRNNNQNSY